VLEKILLNEAVSVASTPPSAQRPRRRSLPTGCRLLHCDSRRSSWESLELYGLLRGGQM